MLSCCYAAFCSSVTTGSDDLPMFQHDPQHTGFSSSKMPTHPREVWTYKDQQKFGARVVLSEEKLFVADYYIIYSLDIEDGSLIWSYELERKWMWLE